MLRCRGYLNEVEEFIWHDPQNSDLIHVRIVCILCDELHPERDRTDGVAVT